MAPDTLDNEHENPQSPDDAESIVAEAETDADEAGNEGDANESAEGQNAEGAEFAQPASQQGQGEVKGTSKDRIRQLVEEREREREARIRYEQELQLLQRQQAEAQQRAQQQYLENLSPEERQQVLLQQQMAQMQQQMRMIQMQQQDLADRTAFQELVSRTPNAAKFADQVEERLKQVRANGQDAKREVILAYLLGQEMLKAAPRVQKTVKAAAAGRPASRAPARARGDVGGSGPGDDFADLESRLGNVTF